LVLEEAARKFFRGEGQTIYLHDIEDLTYKTLNPQKVTSMTLGLIADVRCVVVPVYVETRSCDEGTLDNRYRPPSCRQ
jgi:hypothetical protein